MITQERLNQLLEYNQNTGIFTRKTSRGGRLKGEVVGFKDVRGYISMSIDNKLYYAHRLAWMCVFGVFPPDEIDHINHDRSDNRITNLRKATHIENGKNKAMIITNKTGITGVRKTQTGLKWKAEISVKAKTKHLGCYFDKFEAICARKSAEIKYGYHENHGY